MTIQTYVNNPAGTGTTAQNTSVSNGSNGSIYEKILQQKALWDAYAASAAAQLQSAVNAINATNQEWQSNGITYTGTSVPATPATESGTLTSSDYCGAGSYLQTMTADDKAISVTARFKAKKLGGTWSKQYRWVEEIAPVAPGNYYTAPAINDGSYGEFTAEYTALLGVIPSLSNATIAGLETALYNASQAAIGREVTTYGSPGTRVWTCTSTLKEFLNTRLDYTTPSFGGSVQYVRPYMIQGPSAGVNGQWHQEFKWTYSPTQEDVAGFCKNSTFLALFADSSRGGRPKSPCPQAPDPFNIAYCSTLYNSYNTIGAGITPVSENPNVLTISNTCGGGTTSAPDIFKELTQLEIDDLVIEGYTIEGEFHPAIDVEFTTPGDDYVLQTGSLFSLYTERKGALVFDLHLKKWGKLKNDYKVLTDYLALNTPSYNLFSHTDLGITGGLLKNGLLYNFDTQPSEGYIKYGKVGYYRLGVVHFLETRLDFRRFATGTLTIETSLNGRTTDSSMDYVTSFAGINTLTVFPNLRYRWYNIKLEGEWDLQYMEVRANFSGRR